MAALSLEAREVPGTPKSPHQVTQLVPPTPPMAFSEHLLYTKSDQSPPWWGPKQGLQNVLERMYP